MRIKENLTTIILFVLLVILSVASLFVGVLDINLFDLIQGDTDQLGIFVVSRLPRLWAILCTGIGMSVSGLIMQQLCTIAQWSDITGIKQATIHIRLKNGWSPEKALSIEVNHDRQRRNDNQMAFLTGQRESL